MTPLLSLYLLWTAISYGQSADHNVSVFIRWKNVNVSPQPIRLSVPLPSSGTIINKITYRSCNRNNSSNWPSCFPSSDFVAGSGDAPPSPHPPECTRVGKEDGLACKSSRTICSPILSNDVLYMFKLSVGNTESEWVPSCDPGLSESSPSPSTDAPPHQTKSPPSDSFQFVVWQIILIAIGGTLIMVLLIVGVACCCGCCRRNRKGFYDVSTPRPTPNVATNDLAYSNASMGPSNGGGSVRGSRASVSRVGTTLSLTSGSGAKTKKKKEFWKDEELSVVRKREIKNKIARFLNCRKWLRSISFL